MGKYSWIKLDCRKMKNKFEIKEYLNTNELERKIVGEENFYITLFINKFSLVLFDRILFFFVYGLVISFLNNFINGIFIPYSIPFNHTI